MGQTITEKILSKSSGRKAYAGEVVWAKVDILMSHDPCAPGVFSVFYREFTEQAKPWDVDKFVMIPDHFIYTTDTISADNIRVMREFAQQHNITHFYDVGTEKYKGVCHVGLVEGGHVVPGEVLIGTDSHTCTGGAFGTFATGVGITDGAFVLGTGEIALRIPPSIKVTIDGKIPNNILAKDIILEVIRILGVNGATYCAIEFEGSTIEAMSVEDRMTLANMVVEAGAKNGIMKPNKAVHSFMQSKGIVDYEVFEADVDAKYIKYLHINVEKLKPSIAKPYSPDNVSIIDDLLGIEVNQVYIGSCTGGKTEDFIAAAKILRNQKVSIPTYAVPATREVFLSLSENYINGTSVLKVLKDAGVYLTEEASCAACIGGPIDTFGRTTKAGNVVSTTNRNFMGRMGHKDAKIYLSSPYVAAASAIAGKIVDPLQYL